MCHPQNSNHQPTNNATDPPQTKENRKSVSQSKYPQDEVPPAFQQLRQKFKRKAEHSKGLGERGEKQAEGCSSDPPLASLSQYVNMFLLFLTAPYLNIAERRTLTIFKHLHMGQGNLHTNMKPWGRCENDAWGFRSGR